ncbi:MAG TPA: hypothetical protein VHS26_01810, partial [Solirubrobacteraceae bacterium]|nr:hypothetical protein [Solirubrobacteraceae bacterium]
QRVPRTTTSSSRRRSPSATASTTTRRVASCPRNSATSSCTARAASASDYYGQLTQAISERYGVDTDVPWGELPESQRDFFLYGTNGEPVQVTYRNRYGRRRSYATRFEGIVASLQRRYRETDSEWTREKIEEFMSLRPCPACGGARSSGSRRSSCPRPTATSRG